MAEKDFDFKKPLKSLLLDQKNKFNKALDFYQTLEEAVPLENHWKIQRESPFQDRLGDIIPGNIVLPTHILQTALNTIEEYITAIDNFTADQFAAFLLGVGLSWVPIRYWGIQDTYDHLSRIKKAIAFYEHLEAEIPEEEYWKIKKTSPFEALPELVPPSESMPSEVLGKSCELVESMLRVLEDRPF